MTAVQWTSERAGIAIAWAVIDNAEFPVSISDGGVVAWSLLGDVTGASFSLAYAWAEYPAETTNILEPIWTGTSGELVPLQSGVYCVDGCAIETPIPLSNGVGTGSLALSGVATDVRSMIVGLLANVLTAGADMTTTIADVGDRESKLGQHYPIEGPAAEYLTFQKGGNAGWTWHWSSGEEGMGVVLEFTPLPPP